MSYETDIMKALSYSLKNTESLKNELKKFNENADVLKRIAVSLEKQNELKEIELGLNNLKLKSR